MTITVLIENSALPGFSHEHGLSLLIEHGGKKYLLDTGSTGEFINNCDTLGIQCKSIDVSVLSHGHFDHSGGYEAFFARNDKAPVYLRSECRGKFFASHDGEIADISIPKGLLEKYSHRFIFIDRNTEIAPGVWLISHKDPGLAARGEMSKLYKSENGGLVPDDFSHEHSLVFSGSGGIVIFNSCSHTGGDKIVRDILKIFPDRKILAFIGGLHLMGYQGDRTDSFSKDDILDLGKEFLSSGVEAVYTGHCTGDAACELLETVLGSRLHRFTSGQTINIDL